jgi:hypothetical protein
LAVLAAVGSLLALPVAPAVALAVGHVAQAHAVGFSFSGPGSGAGQMSLAGNSGIATAAVSGSVDDVFVADTGNNRVDEFEVTPGSSTAMFVRAWGWGVADGKTEALQTCIAMCFKGLAGTGAGELETPLFVAIDNSAGPSHGDVYVASTGEHLASPKNIVTKFTSEGALVESWGVKGQLTDGQVSGPKGEPVKVKFGQPSGLAVDAAGDLFVYVGETLEAGGNHMYEFGQAGNFVALGPADIGVEDSPQGIAVDGLGNVYVSSHGGSVVQEPSNLNVFDGVVRGFGVAPSTGDLYVDSGSAVGDVIASQCVPSAAGCELAQPPFGVPVLSGGAGVAVDSSGVVFVANSTPDQVVVFPVSMEAERVAASGVGATAATVNGEVSPAGGEVTKCRVEYGETSKYGKSAACELPPPYTGTGPVKVHAALSGLSGGTSYHYRLRLVNSAGEELVGEDERFTTLPIAVVEETSTESITPTSAVLSASVNPKGVANTTCEVEYGTTTSYGSKAACNPATLSGTTGVPISLKLGSLTEGTTYHWRVVIPDENGTVDGADNTFVYLLAGPVGIERGCANEELRGESLENPATKVAFSRELPDCRAYEMVSPPAKNGTLLAPPFLGLLPQIATSGERLFASTLLCFDGPLSCTGDRASKGPPFEFVRASTGWQTHPLAPPANTFELNSVWAYSPNTGLVLYSSPVASGTTDEFYARQPAGAMEPIGPIAEHRPFSDIEAAPMSATSDLSHVVYTTKQPVWTYDMGKQEGLYEYVGLGGSHPLLVGVSGGRGSNDLISTCNTALGSGSGEGLVQALSSDGRIVYFTAEKAVGEPCPGGSGANETITVPVNEVFARVDGEGAGAHTLAISQPKAPETTASTPADENCTSVECQKNITEQANWHDALLEGASEDGTKALFLSTQQLTNTATQDPTSDSAGSCRSTTGPHGCNLYMYDQGAPTGHNLIDLSAGDSSGLGPEVQGVMAVSAEGSHVYFVAKGVLAGTNHQGQEAAPGADNLYLYERDPTHPSGLTTFIATLPGTGSEQEQWHKQLIAANVSADGSVLVFTSDGALTADATQPQGPTQVYRYDARSEQLLRVSIGEHGFNDNGNQGAGEARLATTGTAITQAPRGLSISGDGSIVFFQSPVGLIPGAPNDVSVNGRFESSDLAQNIYEWETQGKGGCEQPSGCIHLITDGHDTTEGHSGGLLGTSSSVELLGTDPSGANVFFTTADPLVKQDTDTELDIYDARVHGGFPAPVAPEICQGDACRPPPAEPPSLGQLGSLAFTGAGNPLLQPPKPPPARAKTAAQLRAEQLARALRACHKLHGHKKRTACERTARRRYGPKKAAKAKHGKGR